MHLIQWDFLPAEDHLPEFLAAYGSEGEWVRLFRRDARYRWTRLLREVGAARVYVTMDCWESHQAYEEFREKFAAEYAEIDRKCVGLTEAETLLNELQS